MPSKGDFGVDAGFAAFAFAAATAFVELAGAPVGAESFAQAESATSSGKGKLTE